jgi:hypothetical protein
VRSQCGPHLVQRFGVGGLRADWRRRAAAAR